MLGPVRDQTQVEISLTDAYKLGVRPPVRDSGDVDRSVGLTIEGPKGSIALEQGVILAKRHIHLSPEDAAAFGLVDKQLVSVRVSGERALVFEQVLCRVSRSSSRSSTLTLTRQTQSPFHREIEVVK